MQVIDKTAVNPIRKPIAFNILQAKYSKQRLYYMGGRGVPTKQKKSKQYPVPSAKADSQSKRRL